MLKSIIATLTLVTLSLPSSAFASAFASSQNTLQHLDELAWKHRVILIWSANSAALTAQLKAQETEINDRHILWFILNETKVVSNFQGTIEPGFTQSLTQRFDSPVETVLLIGKDGGIKDRASALDLDFLFGEIDQMPMRQREMRQQRSQ